MSASDLVLRIFLAIILPPLGVIGLPNTGCGTILLLTLLTVFFWIPGTIAALIIIVKEYDRTNP